MKRFLMLLFTTLLLTTALCVSVSASDFDAVAEDLSVIGMFRGTGTSFELDRAPKRSEAAIMLVRLYGAEEEAKAAYEAGEISHPFNDVSEYTSPYVAWLYTKGITNGFTETTYASQRDCSALNYVVFLLRALGYKDGVDFEYAEALTFAQEKGFYDPEMFPGTFLRDDLAAVTYQGLAADMADGKTYLLDSLIASGAIDKTDAKPMTEKMEAFRAMQAAMTSANELEEDAMDMSIKMDMLMDMAMVVDGTEMYMTSSSSTSGRIQMNVEDEDNIQMAYEITTESDGTEMSMGIWVKDGWMYQSLESGYQTMYFKYPLEDELTATEDVETVEIDSMDVSGLAMIESITSKKSGSNTIYTLAISENMGGLLDIDEITGEDSSTMEISEINYVYTLDRKGNLKSVQMLFDADMTMDIPMDDGTVVPTDVACSYDMTMTINTMGSSVKVTYPNFSDFVEIDPNQLA